MHESKGPVHINFSWAAFLLNTGIWHDTKSNNSFDWHSIRGPKSKTSYRKRAKEAVACTSSPRFFLHEKALLLVGRRSLQHQKVSRHEYIVLSGLWPLAVAFMENPAFGPQTGSRTNLRPCPNDFDQLFFPAKWTSLLFLCISKLQFM